MQASSELMVTDRKILRSHVWAAHSGAEPADGIVGCAPALRDTLDRMRRVAPTDATVLLTGETGTGKELLARAIHRRSRRAARPLIATHLAAIPESLTASELFGHEAGAFTGALRGRPGYFDSADRGTLFLDEVGELSAEMQVALLRAVQDGEFTRVGASQPRRVDVRLIAATNRDLEQAAADGRFRADLFYRLSVFPIRVPPLRERREDIVPLAEHFLARVAPRLGRRFDGIESASLERLAAYDWPGNIRQLQNVIEQSAILCDEPELHVPPALVAPRRSGSSAPASDHTLRTHERRLIEEALQLTRGRVSGPFGAATRLGISRATLESKIKRFQIDKSKYMHCE